VRSRAPRSIKSLARTPGTRWCPLIEATDFGTASTLAPGAVPGDAVLCGFLAGMAAVADSGHRGYLVRRCEGSRCRRARCLASGRCPQAPRTRRRCHPFGSSLRGQAPVARPGRCGERASRNETAGIIRAGTGELTAAPGPRMTPGPRQAGTRCSSARRGPGAEGPDRFRPSRFRTDHEDAPLANSVARRERGPRPSSSAPASFLAEGSSCRLWLSALFLIMIGRFVTLELCISGSSHPCTT
jgi:hypothetical protein